jgi:phage terminase large subunit-like protein
MRLRPFQREFIEGAFAPGVMTAGLSIGRGNGKTGLSAALCTYALYGADTFGPRVFAVASSERQASILFGEVSAMVAMDPELTAISQVHSSKVVVPSTDGLLSPLPASPKALQGYAPALVVVDECAEVDAATFEAMALSLGKTANSLLIGISTAPVDPDSSWNRLRELAHAGEDPSLYWREWSAPEGCDPSDPAVWAACNPAYGDFLDPAAVASSYRTTRLESFMRYRLNMTVEDAGTWIPWGVFEGLAEPREIPAGSRVVLAFDGSVNTDSTALVAVTVDERPFVSLLSLWERPDGVQDWQVPRDAVESAVEAAMSRFDVVELVADPHWWQSEIQRWEVRWPGRVLTFGPHVPQRMVPACDKAYALISEGRLSHSGDKRLEAHVRHCVVRQTSAGPVITKDHKNSARKIDAAIALIIGVDRALWHAHQPVKRRRAYAF